ncbi:MAG: methyltransferase domain-containing protein [Acidimicrobiales bacterium]
MWNAGRRGRTRSCRDPRRRLGVDDTVLHRVAGRRHDAEPGGVYRREDLDLLELEANSADHVFSSLAPHYVRDLDRLIAQIAGAMRPGGSLVFSVEHPIYSAPTNQSFVTTDGGDRVWPLDNYLVEGERTRTWFVDGVIKQHRTIATYVNTLVAVGLTVEQLVEWGPTAAAIEARPELAEDLDRPWFLLLRADKPGEG